jgi:hypothetical protein
MIVQLKSVEDLREWWLYFKRELDPKSVEVDPLVVEQHVVNILSVPNEGWVGLNLDNKQVLGFLIMKRKLSLLPHNPEYETLLTYFAPSQRKALFDLIKEFETWAESVGCESYTIQTNCPKIFFRSPFDFKRHSINLKRTLLCQ